MEGLGNVEEGPITFSFVHMFHSLPFRYVGGCGSTVHSISQGEESEGQHSGLKATHRRLRANEKLFAFLDHISSRRNLIEWRQSSPVWRSICITMFAFGSCLGRCVESVRSGTSGQCCFCSGQQNWSTQNRASRVEGVWVAHP